MSLTKEQNEAQAFCGQGPSPETSSPHRDKQGTADQHPTKVDAMPESPVEVSQPAPKVEIPHGVGLAITIPIASAEYSAPAPTRVVEAIRAIPVSLPATVVQNLKYRVGVWYGLTGDTPTDAIEATAWRLSTLFRLMCAANGWVLPAQRSAVCDLPTESTTIMPECSSFRMYSLADIAAALDAMEIPTREEQVRNEAKWAAERRGPDGILVDPEAVLPEDVLQRFLVHPQGRATWDQRRPDLPSRALAYDQEIVRIALTELDCDLQTAANAVIHNRRHHGLKPELRLDYIKRLLSKERSGTAEPVVGTPREESSHRGRRQISVAANDAEQAIIAAMARREGLTPSNYIRSHIGMPLIYTGRPDPTQEARRDDWIGEKLIELGIDPARFFPADEILP